MKNKTDEKLLQIVEKRGWIFLCCYYSLPEEFISKYADEVDWKYISECQKLSEAFIEKHINEVDWGMISMHQKLSEAFMERHAGKVHWNLISKHQTLSEIFIEKHADKVDWKYILEYQKLSEAFIEKYADKVDWDCISAHQKLSETFIEKYSNKLNWNYVSKYQKLSEAFIEKHKTELHPYMENIKDSWQYKTEAYKKEQVIETGLYECYDDYFIAYKGIRSNRYSKLNFQYQYLPEKTYETFADYSRNENSFGFSAWTKKGAMKYCDELVIKVKIYYKDIARVVHDGGKIRCCKMTVLD